MIILTIRTDKPEAEIGLFEDNKKLVYKKWQAHRQLAETLHKQIKQMLKFQKRDWNDVQGLVYFEGPGSFTGLRIGAAVANSLAYGLNVPIAAEKGENWQQKGISRLAKGEDDQITLPKYGSPAKITTPKK